MALRDERVREHILAVTRRNARDYDLLADALQSATWPDGGVDRRHDDAASWLERFAAWRGRAPTPTPRGCGCRIGRCLVCN
jgi:hypothetical protein